jgi:hypothetical protein
MGRSITAVELPPDPVGLFLSCRYRHDTQSDAWRLRARFADDIGKFCLYHLDVRAKCTAPQVRSGTTAPATSGKHHVNSAEFQTAHDDKPGDDESAT